MSRALEKSFPILHDVVDSDDHILALIFLHDASAANTGARPPAKASWNDLVAMPDERLPASLAAACAACRDEWGDAIEAFFDRVDFSVARPSALRQAMLDVERFLRRCESVMSPQVRLGETYQMSQGYAVQAAQGAFFTPYHVAEFMATITGVEPNRSVLDPACGAGAMLIAALEVVRRSYGPAGARTVTLVGVDLNPRTAAVARASLLLVGADPDQFWIGVGNSLTQPLLLGRDLSDGTLKPVDMTNNRPSFGPGAGSTEAPPDALVVPDRVLYRCIRPAAAA